MSDLPFWFFETVDLPPEQDFLQGQETDRASVLAFLEPPLGDSFRPDRGNVLLREINQRLSKAFDRLKPVRLQRVLIRVNHNAA
jgi:hypothetical protein